MAQIEKASIAEVTKAIETITTNTGINRIDGENWSVYYVGSNLIRVDFKLT